MRYATPTTKKVLTERYKGSLRNLAAELGLPPNANATLSRVMRGIPGVSLTTENDLRQRLDLEPITRTRYGRPCIPWAQYVLIKMEAQRRDISPADLITQALGITDSEADR